MTYTNLSTERADVLGDQIHRAVEQMPENGNRNIRVRVRNGITGKTKNGYETRMTEFHVTGHVYLRPTDLFNVLEDGEHFAHIATHIGEASSNIEVVKEQHPPDDTLFV